MTTTTTTVRALTAAEAATYEGRPAHRTAVDVEINEDGRATLGRATTVHRATVWTYRNSHGESVGAIVTVSCGSRLYRNAAGKAQPSRAPQRYDVDCAKCLAAH